MAERDHITIDIKDEEDFEEEDTDTDTDTETETATEESEEEEEVEELIRVENSNDLMSCEGKTGNQTNGGADGRTKESNRDQIDGLICPICYEAWTSSGDHQICCLPCGHLYGFSCIKEWLQRGSNSGKCPQCNGFCRLEDVRVLYAGRLCVADEQLHKVFIDRVQEALREKLEREMEEKMENLRRKMEERFEKVERDLEEIKKQNMFDQNSKWELS